MSPENISAQQITQQVTGKIYLLQLKRTIRFSLLSFFIVIMHNSIAQKVAPVNRSPLTSIDLPQGSKHDKRLLAVAGAQMLLDMEGKKTAAVLKNTEVLSLPPTTSNGYTADSFLVAAQQAGWVLSTASDENNYVWMQQNGKYILAYFSTTKKETSIYFAESNQPPPGVTSPQEIQTNILQPINTNTEQQAAGTQPEQQPQNQIQENNTIAPVSSAFKYNTSNFDDGWTATEQTDWVQVTKEDIKVLLHYPKEGTVFPADPDVLTNAAWNILVAPRYSNLKNYKTAYISTYNRPYLGMGHATENASGKEVFVLLFRQGAGWLEFVSPDKNSFIQHYKFDPETIQWNSETDLLKPLDNMSNYNKFAVDAADFTGKWTSDFTGIQQLYNVYTGDYAGMHMNQSNEEFVFATGNTYNWKLLVVNGMAGNAKFSQVKSSGKFTVPNNWQIHFSKIESKAVTYHAHWSCIKGARILNLLNAVYPGSGIYTRYGLAK